jgi:hypothetical protein
VEALNCCGGLLAACIHGPSGWTKLEEVLEVLVVVVGGAGDIPVIHLSIYTFSAPLLFVTK